MSFVPEVRTTNRRAVARNIGYATILRLEKGYDASESISPPLDRLPAIEEQRIYRQTLALKVRKHMVPHSGDGLQRVEDYNSGTNKISVHILVESLPVIWSGTPYGHLDGLKKCVIFVAIAKKSSRPRTVDPEARLPELSVQQGEVFWVAGVSGDEKSFVAKSQDQLIGGVAVPGFSYREPTTIPKANGKEGEMEEGPKWEDSKWGLVSIKDCALAVLDVKDGAWIMCDAV